MGATGANLDIATEAVPETGSLTFATASHIQETGPWCPKLGLGIRSHIKKLFLTHCFLIPRKLVDRPWSTDARKPHIS